MTIWLWENIKDTSEKSGIPKKNQINNIQVSQLNSNAVRAQLKAAGVDINSKQYKAVINQMMKGYNKDGDYVGPGGIVVPGISVTFCRNTVL